MTEPQEYWLVPGRIYRGKSGKDRVFLSNDGGMITYRHVNTSGILVRTCWISTWLEWCKERLPGAKETP